jgi:hypothetical protein
VQTVHLFCTETNTISKTDRNELLFEPRHLGVPSGASKMISEAMQYLAQTMHLHWKEHCFQTDWIKLPFEPRHLGVPSGASKTISKPMVRMAQTMHPSCTATSTISKRTERRFYMTHITLLFHRVRPKWFLSLRYVRGKPCTYLESRLALSPKGPKRDSTRPTSPRSSIGCV